MTNIIIYPYYFQFPLLVGLFHLLYFFFADNFTSISSSKSCGFSQNLYLSSKVVKSISNVSKVSLISSSSRFSFRFISFISCFVNDSTDSKCRLDRSVYDDRDRWIAEKRRCECKELIDKGECDIGSIWNHSNCECECDKSCDVGEYLEYEKYKCTKKYRLIN